MADISDQFALRAVGAFSLCLCRCKINIAKLSNGCKLPSLLDTRLNLAQ
jgi:hypothetical protein